MDKAILAPTGKTLRDKLLDGGVGNTYFINQKGAYFYKVIHISEGFSPHMDINLRKVNNPYPSINSSLPLGRHVNDIECIWENKDSK